MKPEDRNNSIEASEFREETETGLLEELISLLSETNDTSSRYELACGDNRVKELESNLADPDRLEDLLKVAFPDGPKTDSAFYQRLWQIHGSLGASNAASRVVGRLWSAAMATMEPQSCEEILSVYAACEGVEFCILLASLHVVLGKHELRPSFAVDFLTLVLKRVRNDMVKGLYYSAVREFCERHCGVALRVLSIIQESPRDDVELAVIILGMLRKLSLGTSDREEFDRVSRCFADHERKQFRTIFNWSWVTTAFQDSISKSELADLFERYSAGSIEEKHEIVGVVCQILCSPMISRDVLELGLTWLPEKVDRSISSIAKFHVVHLVDTLSDKMRSGDDQITSDPTDLLFAIQPIPVADKGTWKSLERHFVKQLDFDESAFNRVFFRFAAGDPIGLLEIIREPKTFEWLLNKMRGKDFAKSIVRLFVSTDSARRRLGLQLFDSLAFEMIPSTVLEEVDDLRVRLAFYEFQRSLLHGETSARILVSLLTRAESMEPEFQREFVQELILKARDSKLCRDELTKRAPNSPMVKHTLQVLERHFESLNLSHDSDIGAMEVPGYHQAAKISLRRLSQESSERAKEYSELLSHFKKNQILYGNSMSSYHGNQLGSPSPYSTFSCVMEIPVTEFSDPEGMLLKRIESSSRIARLTAVPPRDDPKEER